MEYSKMKPNQKVIIKDFMDKYFLLLEKYWNPVTSEEYWDHFTEEAMAIVEEFTTADDIVNDFLQSLVVAFLNSREMMI